MSVFHGISGGTGPVNAACTPRLSSPTRNLSTPSLGGPPPVAGAGGRMVPQAVQPVSHPGWQPSPGGMLSPSRSSAALLSPGTMLHTPAAPPSAMIRNSNSPVRHQHSQHSQHSQQQQQQQQQGGAQVPGLMQMVAATPRTPGTNNAGASCNMTAGASCNINPSALKPHVQPFSAAAESALQVEVARRQAAEARVRELEALVSKLRGRLSTLEERRTGSPRRGPDSPRPCADNRRSESPRPSSVERIDDPIDRAICAYLERNPDFPVSIQKVARNYYVFGDRGTVYVTQRGEHIVVRVGGGFKSLQVFMDERALMVQQANNISVVSEKSQSQIAAVAA